MTSSKQDFDEVVANISSKKPIALRMGKEVMATLAGMRQHGCGPGPGAERHPVADLCAGHPGGHGHISGRSPRTWCNAQKQANIASDEKK